MESGSVPRLDSHRLQFKYCSSLKSIADGLRDYLFLRQMVTELDNIASNVVQPFNVAVFGRMKTGKSTLINALIGRNLAVTGVEEATATINRITYADGDNLQQFTVNWKDAPPESFPVDELQRDWTGTSSDVLERVARTAWLELRSNAPVLRDLQIIDTPGTGSTAAEHESIAKQFISGQQADALVYVFSPVGRETDEEALLTFKKGCLPGSNAYNSVAVLHKWDHIFWGNGGDWADIESKAQRLQSFMQSMVAEVIPVSGPLALIAKTASEDFWRNVIDVLKVFSGEEELTSALSRDGKWDREEFRKNLRQKAHALGLPWSSFQIMLRNIYRKQQYTVSGALGCTWELSGMDKLEKLLDKQFFKQSAVIRQKQTRAKTTTVLRTIYNSIDAYLKEQSNDIDKMFRLANEIRSNDLVSWVENKKYALIHEKQHLEKHWREIDRVVIEVQSQGALDEATVELVKWLDQNVYLFSDENSSYLRKVLQGLSEQTSQTAVASLVLDNVQFQLVFRDVAKLSNSPDLQIRGNAERLRDCLIKAAEYAYKK